MFLPVPAMEHVRTPAQGLNAVYNDTLFLTVRAAVEHRLASTTYRCTVFLAAPSNTQSLRFANRLQLDE